MVSPDLPPRSLLALNLIVSERLEESTTLEFKLRLPPPGKNDDLSRDIAAMANSQGGVLLYGLREDKTGRASGLEPFQLERSAERVALVAQALDEPLVLEEIYSVPDASDTSTGYLIVVVPESKRRPHLVRGEAWGRSPKGNYRLSRRQLGRLFAESEGFAEEFGLVSRRPGRLKVTALKTPRPGSVGSLDYYLLFENDGESDILNADWRWTNEPRSTKVIDNQFPLDRFHSGATIQLRVTLTDNVKSNTVITTWEDELHIARTASWPVSFL